MLPGWAVALPPAYAGRAAAGDPCVVGRVERGRCLLDLRCVPEADDARGRARGGAGVRVVATAGHVDHGKSTLVRALTGMEPDRWAEERRRGMTIDLGYAWAGLPSGEVLAFVDVPGHQRFIGNMLAGLGPAPAVLVVVAADEGWRRQSGEHLAAVDALGLRHGLLAVTRSDLADPGPATEEALGHLRRQQPRRGRGGRGQRAHRRGRRAAARPRWTGWSPGCRRPSRRAGAAVGRPLVHRPRQRHGRDRHPRRRHAAGRRRARAGAAGGCGCAACRAWARTYDEVAAVARVAVNLRGVERDEVGRGDALLTPGDLAGRRRGGRAADPARRGRCRPSWCCTSARPGCRCGCGRSAAAPPGCTLARPLPLRAGDRALLRDPGAQSVAAGVLVLDADPPALRRRGAARDAGRGARGRRRPAGPRGGGGPAGRRAARPTCRRSACRSSRTRRCCAVGGWLVAAPTWRGWAAALAAAVDAHARAAPLEPGLPAEAARRAVGVPDLRLVPPLAAAAGLEQAAGRVRRPGAVRDLGPAEAAVVEVERRLAADPFAAPEQADLQQLGLGAREVAAAAAAGRLLRLRRATSTSCCCRTARPAPCGCWPRLPQPFTLSAARQALGTTRRVAVPLLEHLDGRGWTRRVDGSLREVVR